MSNSGSLNSIGINVGSKKYTVNKATLQELTNVTSSYSGDNYIVNDYNNDIYNNINDNNITLEELKIERSNNLDNTSDKIKAKNNNISQSTYNSEVNFLEKLELGACKTILEIDKINNDIKDWLGPEVLTAVQSFSCGVVGMFEDIADGIIMAGGTKLADWASREGNEELAEDIKNITADAIGEAWSDELYQNNMETLGVDEEIANGTIHTVGNIAGTMWGYIGVGKLFTPFMSLIGMSSSMGSSAEVAFQSGATFEEATVVSEVSGIIGLITGGLTDKFSGSAATAEATKQVLKYGVINALTSMTEPVINSVTEYFVYGKDMLNEDGTKKYNNMADYYAQSGGVFNTIFAGIVGGGTTILGNVKGKKNVDVDLEKKGLPENFDDNDITALLQDAETDEYYSRWKKREISDWAHNLFDSVLGAEQIDETLKKVNKVSDEYWPTLLRERGLPDNIKGFVDGNSNLYLPESANKHSAYHEAFHLLSELKANSKGFKYVDNNGIYHKITGIREYFEDGFNSTWANETLTDFLASKYSDGKIYESIYSKENVKLWDRIDSAMTSAYGDAGDGLLVNAYLSNDTAPIRSFFDEFCSKGTYDDFTRTMQNFDIKSLDDMVSSIEKSVSKSNGTLSSIIKAIFGGGK